MTKSMKTPYLFIFLFLLSTLLANTVNGQAPYISSLSQNSGFTGETISISGLNFSGITSVKFGGVDATSFTVISENLIQTVVPSGATYDNIMVSSSEGQAVSSQIFNLSYSGTQPSITGLKSTFEEDDAYLLPGDQLIQDLCLCDFDGDGKTDIAVSNNGDIATEINIYRNTSSIGNISLDNSSALSISISKPTKNLRCADLNNDGLPDLVATEGGNNSPTDLFVFQNTTSGTINFTQTSSIELPKTSNDTFKKPSNITLQDLDLDGTLEIIITNDTDNIIYIYNNTSSTSVLSFSPNPSFQLSYSSDEDSGLGDIIGQDLNNDNLPELIIKSGSGLIVFGNNSSPNDYSFEEPQRLITAPNIQRIQTGDFNQDSYQDIVVSNNNSSFEIFLNLTPEIGSEVNFSSGIEISGVTKGWGVDIGDIDGDGDLDLAFGSNGTNSLFLSLLGDVNTINNDNIESTAISLDKNTRNIKLSDIDGDGKVDVIFTNNSFSDRIGNLGIIRNKLCITPVITPSSEVQICIGGSTLLSTSGNPDLTYEWLKDGVVISGATSQDYTVTAEGSYSVKVNDECENESASVVVSQNGALFTAPTFDAPSPICSGTPIIFNLSGGSGDSYSWTGPDDYSSTDKNPTITDPTGGEYTVIVTSSDGCISDPQSQNLSVIQVPTIAIRNDDTDEYCADNISRITLQRSDFGSTDYTYQWLDGTTVLGTGESYSPNATNTVGTSSIRAKIISKDLDLCSYESPAITIRALHVPEANFTSDDSKCVNQDIQFTATQTGETGFEVEYSWDFGDSQTVIGITETTPTHAYTSSTGSPFTAKLDVAYTEVDNCIATSVSTATKSIVITSPPTGTGLDLILSQNTDPDNFEKCPSGDLTLNLQDTYGSIVWKAKLNAADVFTEYGTSPTQTLSDTLIVTADLVDSDLCSFTTNSIQISNLQNSGFSIETDASNQIIVDSRLGKIVRLNENQESIELSVPTDITEISWTPLESLTNLEDASKNNVTIFPNSIEEKISITGTDIQSCIETDSLTIINEFIAADEAFTPNGDGIGDCWEISNAGSSDFSTCTISIFDGKGRRILRKTGPFPEDCVWEGFSDNGSELPNGIYFYVMNCDQTETASNIKGSLQNSGSILLAK